MGVCRSWVLVALLAACGSNEPAPRVPADPPIATTVSAARDEVGPILMTLRGWQMSKDTRTRGPLAIGDTLRSGDLFSYYVRLDRDAYVYVLQFFADGSAKVLFPEQGDVRVSANQETRVPTDAAQWFQLDDAPGTEHLYVIASATPLKDSAPALAELVGEVRTSPTAASDDAVPPVDAVHGFSEREKDPRPEAPEPQPEAAPRTQPKAVPSGLATRDGPPPEPRPALASPLEQRYQAHFRGVELVRVEGQDGAVYQGRTDRDGVGIAHFSFRHD